MRPVAKRNLWLFRLKYILKLRKHTLKTSTNFSGVTPRLANARPLGRAKLAKAPPPGLTERANAPQLPGLGMGGGGEEGVRRSWN